MKKIVAICMVMSVMCSGTARSQEPGMTGPAEIKIENGVMTPEALWAFGRVGNVRVSPDGRRVAYTVTYYNVAENKGNADIYLMGADGSDKTRLTHTAVSEGSLAWHPDGSAIFFLRDGALWRIDPDSREEKKVSAIDQPIDGYLLAPTGDKVAFAITTKLEAYRAAEMYDDLEQANAMVYDDLMYRHWDTWKDGTYSHIYIGTMDAGAAITGVTDIMSGEPYDSPLKPFGGMEEIAWHPDGKALVYTSKKLTGKAYAFRTNSDLYWYDLETGHTRLLTPDMPGYDTHPVFSPDGSRLIWLSMARGGFEADKERIMMLDLKTDERKDLSETLDASPSSLQWTADGQMIYFTAPYRETYQLFRLTLTDGRITKLTDGDHDYQDVHVLPGDAALVTHSTFVKPAEIYRLNLKTGAGEEISFINRDLLAKLRIPFMEKRFVTTTDHKQMVTWVIYPPDFDRTKKYPMLLMCTGGPQGALSPSFSYRWSYMLMASQGYVVVAPARRGTSGSGQEWTDAISTNHGTQDEQDLLAAVDAVGREPWADTDRIGAMGASYGGYSVFHLAGTHQGRFKAFLAHCGIFNMEFMYTTTEEMFFEEWETGGAPWDKDNKVAQNSFAHSPHLLVKNWDTPIMVVHGEKDFRVPYSQGMAAFNTAQMLGIESKLLIFPTENHWVLSPQNAIVWQREFFKWFDKYLK